MAIDLPVAWTVALNVIAWPVIQLALAWVFSRLPNTGTCAPKPMAFERDGRFYQKEFGIKRWKDRLPDGALWVGGSFAKAKLTSRRADYLRRFIQETWHGELCHWCALAFLPAFFLWNPWWADLIIAAYALAANLPCIFVQRYNRIRLMRVLQSLTNCAAPASRASR